ncbi:MAG: hypothetical protein ACKO5R_14635 [Planctomycetaceae bacterium]
MTIRRPPRLVIRDARATLRAAAWLAVVAALLPARPAEAQRLGRRFRASPTPSRQPLPPSAPASRAPATPPRSASEGGAAGAAGTKRDTGKPAAGDRRGPTPAAERPQTTAAPPAPGVMRAADLAWAGVVPFSADWRRAHPAAWAPEDDAPMIRLAVGDGEPTAAEGAAAPAREARAAGSVLAASGAEPVPLLFPDDTPAADAAPAVAADGTVSVLLRGGDPAEGSAPTGRPAAEAQPALDDARQAPWLPLGTFAALPPGGSAEAVPHVFLELALHRDGRVRGNYFDALADSVQPVAGRLDRQTGTVTWRVARGPECTTAAEGLTSGRAEVRVEGPGGERTWTLLSLE